MANIKQVAGPISAVGSETPWLVLDSRREPVNVSVLGSEDSAGGNTYDLLGLFGGDDGYAHDVQLSQATTVISVTESGPNIPIPFGGKLGHGLAVGDYVSLDGPPTLAGIYAVATVPSVTTYTLTSPVSQTLVPQLVRARTGQIFHVKTGLFTGATRGQFQMFTPYFAIALICTTFVAACNARLIVVEGWK